MANTTQRHLLEVLKQYCHDVAKINSTIENYEQELMRHIAEIVSLERNNMVQQTPIQKKIADKVDTLGQIIFSSEPDGEKK